MTIRTTLTCNRFFTRISTVGLVGLLLLASGTGCGSTRDHRIRQYASQFKELSPERQEAVRLGEVNIGSTPLEVYLIYGPPNRDPQFAVPSVKPGDQWTYLGFEDEGRFKSSFDWAWLPPAARLLECVILFGPDLKVAAIQISPLRDTSN